VTHQGRIMARAALGIVSHLLPMVIARPPLEILGR
jgi:hypothetical protein